MSIIITTLCPTLIPLDLKSLQCFALETRTNLIQSPRNITPCMCVRAHLFDLTSTLKSAIRIIIKFGPNLATLSLRPEAQYLQFHYSVSVYTSLKPTASGTTSMNKLICIQLH